MRPPMKLAAFFAMLVPSIASAACPDLDGTAPFTMFDDNVPTTVYRDAEGNTVIRGQRAGGVIHTYTMYRGLFMLAGPDGQGGDYRFEYGVPLEPVFAFNVGDRFEIPVTTFYGEEVTDYTGIHEIIGHATVSVGTCDYDTVVIDFTQAFEDGAVPTTTLYYAPALGVVIQREFDHDFTPDTPRVTWTTDRITDDPAALVPR